MRIQSLLLRAGGGVVLAACLATGCSEDEQAAVNAVAQKARAAAQQAQSAIAARLPGKLELQLEERSLVIDQCYARFFPAALGRPSVLQICSYRSASGEQFPSVYLLATLTGDTLESTVGGTYSAQLYVQQAAAGDLWHATVEKPAQLRITEASSWSVRCEIVGGEMSNPITGKTFPAEGKLNGVLH